MALLGSASSGRTLRNAGQLTASASSPSLQQRRVAFAPQQAATAGGADGVGVSSASTSAWAQPHVTLQTPAGEQRMATMKDLITVRAKGGHFAPYATRDAPIAGMDVAEPGGTYSSYNHLLNHRIRHIRTVLGPEQRFAAERFGPPCTSQDLGLGQRSLKPPTYPISSSNVTRVASEIAVAMKNQKCR
eukprot:TRINITY_DN54078_c0_g1_i1.p2 TRINITY_DN54078_c0_g1~~TRINITY_DN54078_c0_g1_i1.p2  ORF type:complete len:188 (+),score=42.71 TRINITY_DN54078_c0_g1_i1:74-637(+)